MNVRQLYVRAVGLFALLVLSAVFSACSKDVADDHNRPFSTEQSVQASPIPTTPGEMIIPDDNPMTYERVQLGRALFFDKNLGAPFTKDGKTTGISCASCHQPDHAFGDVVAHSPGIDGKTGIRHTPSIVNSAYLDYYTWDGKFYSLESQSLAPIFNPVEMGNNLNPGGGNFADYWPNPGPNDSTVLFKRLKAGNRLMYTLLLMNAFGDTNFTLDWIAKALASYERSLVSSGSPFDDYNKHLHTEGGNPNAINASAKRGFALFADSAKTNCISCHSGYRFTNNGLANNGLAPANSDVGRKDVTYNPAHRYQFKIPSLRNVSVTGPYMHDGRFGTLAEVLAHYNKGGSNTQNLDPRIRPLHLTPGEVNDIIAFLTTLTDKQYSRTGLIGVMRSRTSLLR